jgi:hypothetical protein
MKYRTLDEAIRIQNDVPQGLSSAIFTRDVLEAEISRQTRAIQQDLQFAREFQEALLPHRYPQVPTLQAGNPVALRFHHVYQPASTVGGDFFDVLPINEHSVGVFVSDVAGHGMQAGTIGDALDRLHAFAIALDGQYHAGEHRLAVHDHSAGPAGAAVAELLGAGQAELIMDEVIKGPVWLHLEDVLCLVDGQFYTSLRGRQATSLVRLKNMALQPFRGFVCFPTVGTGYPGCFLVQFLALLNRLHGVAYILPSALSTLSGVMGSSSIQTPMALCTARGRSAGTTVAMFSPMPVNP